MDICHFLDHNDISYQRADHLLVNTSTLVLDRAGDAEDEFAVEVDPAIAWGCPSLAQ